MKAMTNIQSMRKTETTNAGATIKLVTINGIYRVFVFDNQADILEVKEYAELSLANLNFNYMVSKYSKIEKFDILYESDSTSHKWLYTNLELKGRGITFKFVSDRGFKVYAVTKLAFEKTKSMHSVKFAEHGVDERQIA